MKFLGLLLAHTSSIFNNKSGTNKTVGALRGSKITGPVPNCHFNTNILSLKGYNWSPNENVACESNLNKDEYIKKLESENEKLSTELENRLKMIQSLVSDLRVIDNTRRSCMIYELYQRFRLLVTKDLEEKGILADGKKLEALMEEVRRGKVYPEDKIIWWMTEFESSPEAQALKLFRNDYAHHTIDDINVLRQWRNDLISDQNSQNTQINSASIKILEKVINHLVGPQSKPLQRKYPIEKKLTAAATFDGTNLNVRRNVLSVKKQKKMGKKERKQMIKSLVNRRKK